MRKRRLSNWIIGAELALVLALAVIPRALTLGPTFVVNDETLYWSWSNDFIQALLARDWQATIVGDVYPSVTVMWVQAIGLGLRWLWGLLSGGLDAQFWYELGLDRPLDFALLWQRRLPMALANAALVVAIYYYVRRLWGRGIALVTLALLALDPFLLADARTMRGDSLMAGFMTLSVLGLVAAWRQRPSGRAWGWGGLVFSGVMAGLALLTKMSALPLVVFGLVALVGLALGPAWQAGPDWPRRFGYLVRAGIWPAIVWLAVAAAACFALWPALWVAPGQVWREMSTFAADSADGRWTYFMGRYTDTELMPLFYPVTFFFRSTPLTLLGLALFLAAAVWRYRAIWRSPRTVELGLLVLYSLIYVGVMTAGILKRGWYLLPVFPAAMILSAFGWLWLAQTVQRRWQPLNRRPAAWAGLGLAVLLVIQVIQAIPAHPYYYAYWNPLARGPFEPTRLEMLSWGIDTALTAHWLNAQPDPDRLKLALRPSLREMRPLFDGEIIPFTTERPWPRADYIVLREKHLQIEEYDPHLLAYLQRLTPVYTLTLNGVVFGWIYPGPAVEVAPNSQLAGKATLLGYTLPPLPLAAGEAAPLKLVWHNKGLAPGDYLFVQLVDGAGYVWNETVVLPDPGFEKAAVTPDQVVHSQVMLLAPVGTPPGVYFLRGGVYSRARQETLGYFSLPAGQDQLTVIRSTGPAGAGEVNLDHRLDAGLSPELSLLGFNLDDDSLALPEDNWLELYWQALADVAGDYVVGLQLLDGAGEEAAYWLGRPVLSGYPTTGWQRGEIVRDPWRLALPPELPPGEYRLRAVLYEAAAQAAVGQVDLGQVQVVERRREYDAPEMGRVLNVDLNEGVRLLGYDLFAEPLTGGGRLRVVLYWQGQAPLARSYTVFVQLLDPAGVLVAQHDGLPAEGAAPTPVWATGEVVTDRHLVEFGQLAPGVYRLVVGLYDSETGQRLAVSASGPDYIELEPVPIE